jgi:phosphatidylinositol-3-phosphatase
MTICRPRLCALLVSLVSLYTTISFGRSDPDAVNTAAARVRHVFVIVLENKSFDETFITSSQDPYLRKTLVPLGGLLTQYYGTGHASLGNYISMISGQAPTRDTANDCLSGSAADLRGNYNDIVEERTTSGGQVVATGGCIYPVHVKTFVDQLAAAGFRWKAYMEDMGNDPARESISCGHPKIGIGTDDTNTAEAPSAALPTGDAYAAKHNPFVYFHSIIDSPSCQANVVNLEHLNVDLETQSATPNFSFITPNLCHDGHDGSGTGERGTICADGEPGGLTSADAFLHRWVPRILNSPAYKENGLLIITFDEGNYSLSERKDPTTGQVIQEIVYPGQACCNERPGPNLEGVRPATVNLLNTPTRILNLVTNGYGGDRIGALLLSPFIEPGAQSETSYNHYSLLKSLENIFGIHQHLGYASGDASTGYRLDTIGNDAALFKRNVKSLIAN